MILLKVHTLSFVCNQALLYELVLIIKYGKLRVIRPRKDQKQQ